MLLAVAALLVSVAVIAGVLVRARETPKALDENLLVVAPFEVLGPGLELWREGMVDLLARTFDGAGALRTVSPSTAVRQWRGSADPEAAGRFARRFGARLAVFGAVVPARGDSVRLRAALLDVGRGTVVAEAEVPGGAEEMGAVSDSVAFRLLRGLGGTRPIGLVRSSSLGSRSVPALKAFLQGEQLHRAGQWEAAIEAYQTATELDTLFTLAYFHQAMVLGWRESFNDTISNTLFLRAGALNHGLAQRESLLIVAESLGAAATLDLEHPGIWRHYRRQREALEAAAGRYPSDAEVWFTLADSRYHYGVGPGLETRPTDIAAALDRALTADPAFGPAYPHRIELALQMEGPTPARRLIARYRALGPTLSEQGGMYLLDALLDPARAGSAEVERMLDTLPAEALASAVTALTWWGDSAETYLRVARAFLRPRPVTTRSTMLHLQPRRVSNALGTRGRLREAVHLPTPHEYSVVLAGQVGIVSDDLMRTVMARSTGPPFVFAGWMAARRDTAGLAALVRLADSLARVPAQGPDRRRSATIDPQATRAYLALARGDSAAALAALAAIPDTLYGPGSVRVLHAQLLAARGKDREAARVLDLTDRISFVSPARVLLQLERARVGERLGETARAVEGYQFVVAMWRHADPELQPFVTEARAGLERLTAERKP